MSPVVVRHDDPRAAELEAGGWRVAHTSWAARLRLGAERGALEAAVHGARARGYRIEELRPTDDEALLALDAATLDDYPGGVATTHASLDVAAIATARSSGTRYFGAWSEGRLVAATAIRQRGSDAETDFTVVAREHRRRGLSPAVKGASVLALAERGVTTFGTGGAEENAGSLAANRRLGYEITERWRTYLPPQPPPSVDSSAP